VRDILMGCGLDEIITYSMTTPEREALLKSPDSQPYLRVVNPIAADKVVMRHTLLSSALDTVASNLRFDDRVTVFEIGAVYLPREGQALPDEPRHLAIAMTGPRQAEDWQPSDRQPLNFWDIKGVIEALVERLHLNDMHYEPADHPTYHTGRAANLMAGEKKVGMFGELHPLVRQSYDLPDQPVCVAEFELNVLLDAALASHAYESISRFPAVREDIAVVVDEAVPAAQVERTLWNAGGNLLRDVRLFDLYRGEQIGAGRKSLAYRLVYQADDRTLTDDDAARFAPESSRRFERELNATLRM